jgi:hypothetical protein
MRLRHPLQYSLAGALALGVTACQPSLPANGSPLLPAWRPECPGGDSLSITVVDSIGSSGGQPFYYFHTVNQVPLAGENSNVPEYQDCQRFLLKDPGETSYHYDSLYAIFAPDGGHMNLLADSVDTLPYSPSKRGRPAAEILSYGGTYEPLGIGPDFNCLYLYRDGSSWEAKMVHIGTQEQDCENPIVDPRSAPGKLLQVIPQVVPGLAAEDYPTVARWEWDSVGYHQYIGIRCGPAAWCEVGEEGFVSSFTLSPDPHFESVPGPNPTPREHQRVFKIKGWYDRQLLADWDEDQHKPVPGHVWGSIIPHPVIGRADHNSSGYFHPWTNVASVTVSDVYSTKHVTFAKGENWVWLCSGTRSDCGVPDAVQSCSSGAGPEWWAKIQPVSASGSLIGEPNYHCVVMRAHPGKHIPGITRWRWLETDETNWIRCTEGCCELK